MKISTFQENLLRLRRVEKLIDKLWIELRLVHIEMNYLYQKEISKQNNSSLNILRDKHKYLIKRIRYLTNYFTSLSIYSSPSL